MLSSKEINSKYEIGTPNGSCHTTHNQSSMHPNNTQTNSVSKLNHLHTDDLMLDDTSDTISLVSHEDDDSDMASIRALTDRFKYIRDATVYPTEPSPNTSAAILAYNIFNGRLAASDYEDHNSIDFEQTSETESYDQNHYIDEDTYTVQQNKGKPKIVKPTDSDAGATTPAAVPTIAADAPEGKAIRGKKIVSQYRRTIPIKSMASTSLASRLSNGSVNNNKNAIESKKVVAVSQLTPRNQSVVAKTHVLINKAALATKINAVKTGVATKAIGLVNLANKRNIVAEKNLLNKKKDIRPMSAIKAKVNSGPTKALPKTDSKKTSATGTAATISVAAPPAMPDRQGTFVKDEPTNGADVPVVVSEPSSPAKSKLPTKLTKSGIPTSPGKTVAGLTSKLKHPLQRSSSTGAGASSTPASKLQPNKSTRPLTTPSDGGADGAAAQRRRTDTFYRSPSTPSVPQRCNSNASIRSSTASSSSGKRESLSGCMTQPPSRSNSNLGQPKRDITSKIAGLWRKSEAVASPVSGTTTTTTTAAKASTAVSGKPPLAGGNRLIRSSTFESSPTEKKLSPSKLATVKSSNASTPLTNGKPCATTTVAATSGVVRRVKCVGKTSTIDETKRISRLGSFINVDETTIAASTT